MYVRHGSAVHRPAHLPRHVQPRVPPRARHERGGRHELPLLRLAARLRALPVDGARAGRAPLVAAPRHVGRGQRPRRRVGAPLHVVPLRLRALLVHGHEVPPLHLPGRAAGRDARRHRARRHARAGAARRGAGRCRLVRSAASFAGVGAAWSLGDRAHAPGLVLRVEARRAPRRSVASPSAIVLVAVGAAVTVVFVRLVRDRAAARRRASPRRDDRRRRRRRTSRGCSRRGAVGGRAAARRSWRATSSSSRRARTSRAPSGCFQLFTYNYRRAWPDSLDFSAALAGFTRGRRRCSRSRSPCAPCAGTPWSRCARSRSSGALWGLDVYMQKTAQHWGQHEVIEAYYAEPRSRPRRCSSPTR